MSFPRVTPAEARRLVDEEGYRLLDVRSVPEFQDGHPAGSFNIPLMHLDPATGGMRPNTSFVEDVKACFQPGDKIVLSCKSGGRSARAAGLLLESGFQDIVDQRAGWMGERTPAGKLLTPGWVEAGLPVEEGDGGERSYASLTSR